MAKYFGSLPARPRPPALALDEVRDTRAFVREVLAPHRRVVVHAMPHANGG